MEEPKLTDYKKFADDRGFFSALPLDNGWIQNNISLSEKNILRGMHLQAGSSAQSKLVRVLQGSVVDVIADLRNLPEIKTYTYELSASGENIPTLYVPKGFAHGFLAVEDDTIFEYFVDAEWDRDAERIINWQSFPEWKKALDKLNVSAENLVLSDKDSEAPSLEEFIKTGEEVL